ncbi:MAG: enoyl-CoA hydratase/isomerase family protein [Robiginitomaculum sp.]|nr:enoyl-CoA hydratase/isomerase family protein [Robiginitomaculum sp.]
MSEEPEVLVEIRGRIGVLTLNRPKALNSLTLNMIREMTKALLKWRDDEKIVAVVVQGAGDRAFCAGGDIRLLYEGKGGDLSYARGFYSEEYRLNTLIKEYPKPYIAMIDGFVMGGGVGISIHGARRIAGSSTVFAMPETGIGFYPDVGGSYFLPRLSGKTGMWLALTGARLKSADVMYTGIATDFAPSDQHPMIVNRLADDAQNSEQVSEIIDSLTGLTGDSDLQKRQELIDQAFAKSKVQDMLAALELDNGEWATKQLKILSGKSPTALKVTVRQMIEGENLDFRSSMQMELGLSMKFIEGVDFYEGVRALLIDRDNMPVWQPAHLSDISEAKVAEYFTPLRAGEELTFL